MAEFTDGRPSLLTYLGLGLMQSAQRGPKQNYGYNLLGALNQYGGARAQDQQLQLREQEAERQKRDEERQKALLDQTMLRQKQEQDSLGRIRTLIGPRSEYVTPEPPGTPEERRQAALLDYATNVEPKALGGLLGADAGDGSFGLNPIQGMIDDQPAIAQLSSKGGVRLVQLPQGFNLSVPQTWKDTGGEITPLSPRVGGPVGAPVPKTLAPTERVLYKKQAAMAEASGSTRGKTITEREINMEGVGGLIAQARGILQGGGGAPLPTGSGVGSVVDSAGALVGVSPKGADQANQLKVIGGALTSKVPRFQGAQSNQDVQFYKEIAGQVGDQTIPISRRLAALKIVEDIWAKFEVDPKATGFKSSYSEAGYVRTGTNSKGQRVGQRADGTVEVIK